MNARDTELSRLTEEVAALRATVDARLAEDRVREAAFDKLYKELEQYKARFLFEAEKPLLLDLLQFHDTLAWFHRAVNSDETNREKLAETCQYLMDEFLELLDRRDVAPMPIAEHFDPRLHRAIQVTPAARANHDGTVQRVVKKGFLRDGRPLRAADVIVRRWAQPAVAKDG